MAKFLLLLFAVAVATVTGQANRAKVCQKAVNLGVTFYTASELEPVSLTRSRWIIFNTHFQILACAEVPFYNNPNDTETIISSSRAFHL